MNKQKLFFILLLLVAQSSFAQVLNNDSRINNTRMTSSVQGDVIDPSGMSDDEIIEYINEQKRRGMSDRVIVRNLLNRGVSQEKLTELREKYSERSTQNTSGNQGLDADVDFMTDRRRTNNLLNVDAGILETQIQDVIPDSVTLASLSLELSREQEIFGHNIFRDKQVSFEPNLNIATPENYRLGPGDEVIIDVWGASQSTFRDYISPDGYVNIEQLGLIYLSGMTVSAANEHLKTRYGQIYSGLTEDNPSAEIKLTLGQIRSIQVRVMGEVVNPGTYTVSSFASIFHALYLAGGVNDIGSLRNIRVSRGGREVAVLDVYDYLLNGRTSGDIRLSDGDVVTVPTYDRLVKVEGQVKRPMFYEMKESESVADLLGYSGGFARNAYRGSVSIERFGDNGMQFFTLDETAQRTFLVKDGDLMRVDSISDLFENVVEVKGAVYRQGKFQLGVVNTVKELIENAGGLKPNAFVSRAILNRRLPDMSMENVAVDIEGVMAGTVADIELRNYDVLYISSIEDMQDIQYVNVYGEVAFPGKYRFAHNTKVGDVILMAGGLSEKASTARIEVVRRNYDAASVNVSDTIAQVFTFEIDRNLTVSGADNFVLQPFDAVYVRRSPTYVTQGNVSIEGEVVFAGMYVMDNKNMRLSDLVKASGGFTNNAYIEGARVERQLSAAERERMRENLRTVQRQMDSTYLANIEIPEYQNVGIDLAKAIEQPGSDYDLILKNGDRLIIPEFVNTVTISGNVMYPNTVTYKEGENLNYYINLAGGYGINAKKSKAIIVYQNGTIARAKNRASLIKPGCEIIVPTKVKREGMSTAEIFSLASTSASLATVIISLINLITR